MPLFPRGSDLENEPSTQQSNTGLSFSVPNATSIIQLVLDGMDRQGVLMGAGAGTWESTNYISICAQNTTIDYIDAHVYPINRDFVIDRLIQFDAIADANGKRMVWDTTSGTCGIDAGGTQPFQGWHRFGPSSQGSFATLGYVAQRLRRRSMRSSRPRLVHYQVG